MTMRLDIVTNDAGELVRREHARDLGSSVVVAIYRLAKLAQVHDLQNQAFTRQLEQTHQIISDYCLRAGFAINVLFAHKAIFVAGQLLKGSRGVYNCAAELGEIFERLGGSELFIDKGLTREELYAFSEQISLGFRSAAGSFRSPTPKIRLRPVSDAARMRGLELEDLTPDQRIVRTYASAVVIMRRFYEDLQASRYILPRRVKRIAQSLVDLSEGSTPAYLGVTESRNANFDEAGRAVNTAIVAVSMARELEPDRTVLAQIAMAAMMFDVARPRAMALASGGDPAMPGMQGPTMLSEDQEDRLAAGAAAVLTALGRVNEPTIARTVLTFEALWLRRQTWLGPVYWGARPATIHARMLAVARRYNDLLTPEPGVLPPTSDFAIATLAEELKDPEERSVLRMLVSALGLLPTGTVVQLNTNELAEVVRGPKGPGDRPRIRLVVDERGQPIAQPPEIELAQDLRRQVARVVSVDGWRKGLAQGPNGLPPDGAYDPDAAESADEGGVVHGTQPVPAPSHLPPLSPLQPVPMPAPGHQVAAASAPPGRSIADQYADQYAAWGDAKDEEPPRRRDTGSSIQSGEHNSSASLPSLGSSPSAVAEAMGRMINDSLRPPAAVSGDRTVFQPHGPDDVAPERPSNRAKAPREPTARGNLAATPLPHVLVYMLDHSLTGSVVFEGGPGDDAIYFVGGVPAKIRLNEAVGLLGEMLVQGGFVDPKTVDQAVEGARRLGILVGEYLVGHDLASREAVTWALEAQVLHKIAHIANMPPEIGYAYYRDFDILDGWGGGDIVMGAPLNPILASVRNWMDRARIRATLNRIGKHALVLHEDSDLTNLALLPEEQVTLDLVRSETLSLPQLFKRNVADEEVVSSLIYTLAVTRQFAFKGQKKGPMAPRGGARFAQPPRSVPPPGSGSISNPPAASGLAASGTVPSSTQSRPVAAPSRPPISAEAVGSPPPRAMTPPPGPAVSARPAGAGAQPGGPMSVRRGDAVNAGASGGSAARGMAPAARPSGSMQRVNAPQIRPIVRKATNPGPQQASPAEARGATAPPANTPSVAPDEAKTIALTAPTFRKGSAGGRSAAGARPAPGLPSKAAVARPGASAAAAASARSASQARSSDIATKAASGGDVPGFGSPGDVQVEIDDDAGRDDPGMAEAEAALAAMQSFRLAEAALQRGETISALRHAESAATNDPTQSDYATLVWWIRALSGNPALVEDAIATMSAVLAGDPANERALLYRGKLYARTNRFQEALADLDQVVAANPTHRDAQNEIRLLKSRMG